MSASSVPGIPTTSVPAIQFTPQGLILPNDTDILAGVQEDINYAFGGGVNPDLRAPQGQLASSEAAIISDKDAQIAEVVNQMDPQYSSGRFQDAIGRIYFLTRKPATSTVAACVLTGLIGTPIPAGTLAQDTSGNTYALTAAVTIPASGTVMSQWANILSGPVACPAGTLIRVYQAVPGWDAITNPTDGTLGQLVESPQEFEYRRQQSVALNGNGSVPSIYANVFNVDNVLDCYVIDNPEGVTESSNPLPGGTPNSTNYAFKPHSLYVAVVGGAAADILPAIWNFKDPGCNYNGNTTGKVTDPSGYSYPAPSYNVSYEIPAPLPILFAVSIVNTASLPSNIATLVQNAIIAQFNGTNGGQRARIGALLLASGYFGPIASIATGLQLISCNLGVTEGELSPSYQVGIDQAPSISAGNIAVTLV
jgi:hypothetical protein